MSGTSGTIRTEIREGKPEARPPPFSVIGTPEDRLLILRKKYASMDIGPRIPRPRCVRHVRGPVRDPVCERG